LNRALACGRPPWWLGGDGPAQRDCLFGRLGSLRDGKCLQVLGLADILIRICDDRKEGRSRYVLLRGLGVRFLGCLDKLLGDMSGVTILIRVSPIALISLASMTGCPVLTAEPQ
jgi:hypothetical protein